MAILIFDYDGTLHDSMHIYAPAVRLCRKEMAAKGVLSDRKITDDEIKGYLGLSVSEMWQQFAPELSEEERAEGGKYIGAELRKAVERGEAVLYSHALELLSLLKKEGHRLVFLSNCSESYMQLHKKAFHLEQYFDEMYCSEQFGWREKKDIAAELLDKWSREFPAADVPEVYAVGDRYKDMEMGSVRIMRDAAAAGDKSFRIKTIWCSYGFGKAEEGKGADMRADSVEKIPLCIR